MQSRPEKKNKEKEGKQDKLQVVQFKLIINIFDFLSVMDIARLASVHPVWRQMIDSEFPVNLIRKNFLKKFPQLTLLRVKRLGGGGTNTTNYIQTCDNQELVGRIPGRNSEKYLDRKSEADNLKIISKYGIGPKVVFDDEKGLQLTQFIKNAKTMSAVTLKNPVFFKKAIEELKMTHDCKEPFVNTIDVFKRNEKMVEILNEKKSSLPDQIKKMITETNELQTLFNSLKIKKVPCHVDPTPSNFLGSNGRMDLFDWEYCGNNDPIWDLVTFSIEGEFTPEQIEQMFEAYGGIHEDQQALQRYIVYKAVYALWAVLWAQVQLVNENHAFTKEDLIEMIKKRTNEYEQTIASDEYKNAFNAIKSKNNMVENSKVSSSNCFKK